MYPRRDLNRLAAHRRALQRDIGVRRARSAADVNRLLRPWRWLDRVSSAVRRIAPVAWLGAVPLGWLLAGRLGPKFWRVVSVVQWGAAALAGRVRASVSRPR